MDRTLLDYLPAALQTVRELVLINEANEPEIALAWDAVDLVMRNQFIDTADAIGVAVWERELHVTPKGCDTLDTRKARVKAMWNLELPYTLGWLHHWLAGICGADGYRCHVAGYQLIVRLGLGVKENLPDVRAMLSEVMPQNMVLSLALIYNTFGDLAARTHGQLAAYNHRELREEVIE